MSIHIDDPRLADERDIPPLVALINEAFKIELSFKETDRTDADQLRSQMRQGSFYVAERDGTICACIYVETMNGRVNEHPILTSADSGYIGLLAIDPSLQRQGIGRKMMAFAENELRRRGCKKAQIRIIHVRSELYDLYGRMGYKVTGTAPYPRSGRATVPVHFVTMEKSLG